MVWKPFFANKRRVPDRDPPFQIKPLARRRGRTGRVPGAFPRQVGARPVQTGENPPLHEQPCRNAQPRGDSPHGKPTWLSPSAERRVRPRPVHTGENPPPYEQPSRNAQPKGTVPTAKRHGSRRRPERPATLDRSHDLARQSGDRTVDWPEEDEHQRRRPDKEPAAAVFYP